MTYSVKRTENLEEVLRLNQIIFPVDPLEVDKKTVAWILYSGKEAVGFCTARKLGDGVLYMDRGGIFKEHRGKGLHKRLINVRERYAKTNGYSNIITYVVRDNYSSMLSLVRRGYDKYDPHYEWAGKSEKEVIYLIKKVK